MRALFVSHAYAAPEARAKLRALAGLGYTVAAAVPERPGTAAGDDQGVRLLPVPVRGEVGAAQVWDPRALRRVIDDFAPEIVQLEEEPWTPAAAATVAALRRHRVTLVQHTADTAGEPLALRERARRARTLRRADAIAAANGIAAERAAGLRPGVPVAVLPQLGVVPPPAPPPREIRDLALGFVGRLVRAKALDLLIGALAQVHGDWTLTVVGTGPEQEALEAQAARLALAARIRWAGALPRSELAHLWPALEVLVLPARTVPGHVETTGQIVLEGMGHGVPAVVTRSGALPEVVGDTGLVVPEDDPAELAAALQHLHDQPARRLELGAEARRRVLAEYAPDAVARRTIELWHAAIDAGTAAGAAR